MKLNLKKSKHLIIYRSCQVLFVLLFVLFCCLMVVNAAKADAITGKFRECKLYFSKPVQEYFNNTDCPKMLAYSWYNNGYKFGKGVLDECDVSVNPWEMLPCNITLRYCGEQSCQFYEKTILGKSRKVANVAWVFFFLTFFCLLCFCCVTCCYHSNFKRKTISIKSLASIPVVTENKGATGTTAKPSLVKNSQSATPSPEAEFLGPTAYRTKSLKKKDNTLQTDQHSNQLLTFV